MHILSFVFKGLCSLLILAVVGIFVWRIFTSGTPSSMKKIIPNNAVCDTYRENGSLRVFTQSQDNITRGENNSGYFSITDAKFYEDAEQVQVVFRYNNSTIEHLAEDYSLPSLPSRDSELYDVTLTIAYDLTPEDTSDNASNAPESVRFERIHASQSRSEAKNVYNFRKFVFDGVKIDSSVLAVYVDVYYNQDIDYDKEAYGTLIIYDYKAEKKYESLSGSDKDILERWVDYYKD